MKSFAFLAALFGAALAAPAPVGISITKSLGRRDVPNEYTVAQPGGIEDIIITEDNTLNGTDNSDKPLVVPTDMISKMLADPVRQDLNIDLVNNFGGGRLNVYIHGQDSEGHVVFLGPNGELVYPTSGGSEIPIPVDNAAIAIPMPAQGETLRIHVPIAMSSGRVYYCEGELDFFMVWTGQGDGIVQPSISNIHDPSYGKNWGFVELTLTTQGVIWANISFVDFVSISMGMILSNLDGSTQEVLGLGDGALNQVCESLRGQGDRDGRPWAAHCITNGNGQLLRAISPNNYHELDQESFADYWEEYGQRVWDHYRSNPLFVNTQNENGDVECRVEGDELQCAGDNRGYPRPTPRDIWSCDSGPFGIIEGDNAIHYAVVPRLCAAFTRTTLLLAGGDVQPGLDDSHYYVEDPTSHYSRVVHEHEIDGKGYAFPYDDVNPAGSEDQAGLIASDQHDVLTFYVGGWQ